MSKRTHVALLLFSVICGLLTSLLVAAISAACGRTKPSNAYDSTDAAIPSGDEFLFCQLERQSWSSRCIRIVRGKGSINTGNTVSIPWGGWGRRLDAPLVPSIPFICHPPTGDTNTRYEYQFGWPAPCLWGAGDMDQHFDITYYERELHIMRVWPLRNPTPFENVMMVGFPYEWFKPGPCRYVPTGLLPTGLALDTLVFAPIWWLPLASPPLLRRRLRLRRHHCPHCNYNLTSLPPNSPCPECGRATA